MFSFMVAALVTARNPEAAASAAKQAAQMLVQAGQLHRAQHTLKEAMAELRAGKRAATELYAHLLGDLAGIYAELGKVSEALAAREEAVDVLQPLIDRQSPQFTKALEQLADARLQAGEYLEAASLLRDILPGMREGLGSTHLACRQTMSKLAGALFDGGKPRAATKVYSQLVAVFEGLEPNDIAAERAYAHLQLSRTLGASGSFERALHHAERAREMHASGALPQGDPVQHAFSLNAVAGVLEKLDRDDEAIHAMEAALEVATRAWQADDPMLARAHQNLAGLRAHVQRKATVA